MYIPRTGSQPVARVNARPPRERPTEIGPIFDKENAYNPLPEFDSTNHDKNYAEPSLDGLSVAPIPRKDTLDAYLVPSLTSRERFRLSVLWYYTRHIHQDEYLLSKLDTITTSVQENTGWEFAIVGIIDEAVYSALAAANYGVPMIPRRESLCSHTINQAPRSVFMITDLVNDWRFTEAPHIKIAGFRSYAGTQLMVTTDDGQETALGSLCVASNRTEQPLSQKQRDSLIRFADMISWEIVDRTRQIRAGERSVMAGVLLKLQTQMEDTGFESVVKAAVQEIYPNAHISIQASASGTLQLENRDAISYSEVSGVSGFLWEDIDFIELAIRHANYKRFTATQTVRAAAARCGASSQYLVIATSDIQHVFDDIDSWFVERCASVLAESHHKRMLIQALKAKDSFLRSITHQLRTPIHGILASVDLLSEEILSNDASGITNGGPTCGAVATTATSPLSYIATIKSSGRELMSTVNNILKFNTLTTSSSLENIVHAKHDVRRIANEVLIETLQLVAEDQLRAVSIEVYNDISNEQSMIAMDSRWLKDCLQPLLLNGLQSVLSTGCGTVKLGTHYEATTQSLWFDLSDTGVGINAADRERIFRAFEKVDDHKSGAGLGLTLASKIAEMHGGSIELVASLEGHGSHFRARFLNQELSAQSHDVETARPLLQKIPHSFHMVRNTLSHAHMLSHLDEYLKKNGLQELGLDDVGLVVTDLLPGSAEFVRLFETTQNPKVVVCYSPTHRPSRIERISDLVTVLNISGPFCSHRLEDILLQADTLYAELIQSNKPHLQVSVNGESPLNGKSTSQAKSYPFSTEQPQPPLEIPDVHGVLRLEKALLVDDNAINLRILEMFCQKRRIPYVTAQDGLKAEEQFTQALKAGESINLVLMDLQMPLCNGIQATCAIRRIEVERNLPRAVIFMVTGQDSPSDRRESEQAGVDEFLVKPVSVKMLQKNIEKYFGKQAR